MAAAEPQQKGRTIRADRGPNGTELPGATPGVGLSKTRFIPYPTYDGVSALVYGPGGRPSQMRAHEILAWVTEIYEQAKVDLYHLRMLNHWRQQSPFVSRISELADGPELIKGDHRLPLALPPNEFLEKVCGDLAESMSMLQTAVTTPYFNDDYVNQQTENSIRWAERAAGVWHDQHQHIADYQRRTGQGSERVAETAKAAYLMIVATTTGFTAGGAFGIGAGTLRSLVATTSTTAAATGTAAGAMTAAEQLHAGTFDPGAIARTALVEAATTFAMGMVAGGLARVFMNALSAHVLSTARAAGKTAPLYRAAMVHHDALMGNLMGVLAGGGAGALIASVEAVLLAQAGHQLSAVELTSLVLRQLMTAGVYQLAIAIAIRRTNSRFVDLGEPQHPLWVQAPPQNQWGLHYVRSPTQNVDVLTAPKNLDHNGALYDTLGFPKGVPEAVWAQKYAGTHGYLPNSLVIHTHGGTTGLIPGNQNVADLAARELILRASQGDPRSQVLLSACNQVEAIGPSGASNAQAFQADLHKALASKGYNGAFPQVHTNVEPGPTYAGTYSSISAPRPASSGGMKTDAWHRAESIRRDDRNGVLFAMAGAAPIYIAAGTGYYVLAKRPDWLQPVLDAVGIGDLGDIREAAEAKFRDAISFVLASRPDLLRAVLDTIGIGGVDNDDQQLPFVPGPVPGMAEPGAHPQKQ